MNTSPASYYDTASMLSELQQVAARIVEVMQAYPDLSYDGFKYTPYFKEDFSEDRFKRAREEMATSHFAKEVVTAKAYLENYRTQRYGSYGLKHDAERWGRENGLSSYVSNGALIVAAILCGKRVIRERNGPNCTFR